MVLIPAGKSSPPKNLIVWSHPGAQQSINLLSSFFKQSRQGKVELLEYILIDLQQHLVPVIKEKLVLLDVLLISWTDSGLEKCIPATWHDPSKHLTPNSF